MRPQASKPEPVRDEQSSFKVGADPMAVFC